MVLAAHLLGLAVVRNSWLLGILVVATWGILTRFLHWDGLADAADGLLGSFGAARRLEIMRDSRIGAFGAAAMLFAALSQAAAIGSLVSVGAWWPLIAAPVVARAAVVLAAWTIPPARTEGLGLTASIRKATFGRRAVAALPVLLLVGPLAADTLLGPAGWSVFSMGAVLVVMDLAAIGIPPLLARGVGGVTGDLHGATIVLVETVTLVAAALVV
jgi:adenosylcobinamide-GDP ribazoletransferase